MKQARGKMAKKEHLATGMRAVSILAIFGGGSALAAKSAGNLITEIRSHSCTVTACQIFR
jgi:hypothetical protein